MTRGLGLGLVVAAATLAGCWGDDEAGSRRDTRPAPAAERVLEDSECGGFIPERAWLGPRWRRRSTRIGPVRFMRTSGLAEPGLAGRRFLKLPLLVPPSRTVTVEIDAGARSRVGFVEISSTMRWTGSRADLYAAVRVENCPPLPPEVGELPAGERYGVPTFVVVLRDSCVPFTVTRDGGPAHRGVVSLGGGDCEGDGVA